MRNDTVLGGTDQFVIESQWLYSPEVSTEISNVYPTHARPTQKTFNSYRTNWNKK